MKEGRIYNIDKDIIFPKGSEGKEHNGECLIILDGWRIDTNKLMEEEQEKEAEEKK